MTLFSGRRRDNCRGGHGGPPVQLVLKKSDSQSLRSATSGSTFVARRAGM
jgi:hypothetical protein